MSFSSRPRHRVLATGLRLGQHAIAFEQTQWSDIQRLLGPLKMRRQGDAGETEDWTCFTVATGQDRVQIWLEGGELQGGNYIDGVTVQGGSAWPVRECPLIRRAQGSPALDNGIGLGTTRSDIVKRLGQPTALDGASLVYDFDSARRDPKAGAGSVGGRLIFEMADGRVKRFFASKDTSY